MPTKKNLGDSDDSRKLFWATNEDDPRDICRTPFSTVAEALKNAISIPRIRKNLTEGLISIVLGKTCHLEPTKKDLEGILSDYYGPDDSLGDAIIVLISEGLSNWFFNDPCSGEFSIKSGKEEEAIKELEKYITSWCAKYMRNNQKSFVNPVIYYNKETVESLLGEALETEQAQNRRQAQEKLLEIVELIGENSEKIKTILTTLKKELNK